MIRLCRLMALLLVLTLLPAAAEPSARDADWYAPVLHAPGSQMHLLTDNQLDHLSALPSQEVHAIVEALFEAAAGVREQEELALWKTLRTDAQKQARSAENAAYRALTLPWLLAAFAPGNPVAETTSLPTDALEDRTPLCWVTYAALENNPCGQAYLALLAPLGGTDKDSCLAVTQAVLQRWLAELEHAALADINGHYQFWLYAAGTPIDYPVVQCGNNSHYMDRMFNGKKNPAGTIFVDYRNLPRFQDPNTLIYGHHMRDSSMFHALTDYESPGFFDAHPWMVTISGGEIRLVEIFAGYVTDGHDHCYDIALSDETHMQEFVDLAMGKSDFDAHVDIDSRHDQLVTLSTCAYNFENARYVVLGRLRTLWTAEY